MKKIIIFALAVVILIKFASAENFYPPIFEPLPEMNFAEGETIAFQFLVSDLDADSEISISTKSFNNSVNPEENGAEINFVSQENEKQVWQFEWGQIPENFEQEFYLVAFDSEHEVMIRVKIKESSEISKPVLVSSEDYVGITKKELTHRFTVKKIEEPVEVKAISQEENLEYQFRISSNGNLFAEQDWQNESSTNLTFANPGVYLINVRARNREDVARISEWSSQYFYVQIIEDQSIFPPQIQYFSPEQISALRFKIPFYSNPRNAGRIENYSAKIMFQGFSVNQAPQFDFIVAESPNEQILYNAILDFNEHPEFLENLNTALSSDYAFLRTTIQAGVGSQKKIFTQSIIPPEEFPQAVNITLTQIGTDSAEISTEFSNPHNFYTLTSYNIYSTEELLEETEIEDSEFVLQNLNSNSFYERKFYIRPVHNNFLEGLKIYIPPFTTLPDEDSPWKKISNSSILPAEISDGNQFSTLQTQDYIYFTAGTKKFGSIIARFDKNQKIFEYWDGQIWNQNQDVIPEPFSHSHAGYLQVKLFEDTADEGKLFGTAVAFYRIDNAIMDTHGTSVNFKFDGEEFTQWSGNSNYDKYRFKGIIDSWSGSANNFDFAFNPETNKGIAIGTIGKYAFITPNYFRQLTASSFDKNSGNIWKRWNNDSWSSAEWPASTTSAGASAWILNKNISDASLHEYSYPKIILLNGTENYLTVFNYDYIIGSAIYTESPNPLWSHYTENGWESGVNYNYKNIGIAVAQTNGMRPVDKELISINETQTKLIFSFEKKLYESDFNYLPENVLGGEWSQPEEIVQNFENIKKFKVSKDFENNIWIIYQGQNSNIYLTRKINDAWTAPERVYSSSNEIEILGLEIIEENPLAFVEINENGVRKVYAISAPADYWQNTAENNFSNLNTNQISNEKIIWNSSYSSQATQDLSASISVTGQLALTDDGYLFLPQSPLFHTSIIRTESDLSESQGVKWGSFADYFYFPGGVDIYEEKNTAYIINRMVGANGASSITNEGHITAWNYDPQIRNIRQEYLFAKIPGTYPNLTTETYSYGAQNFGHGLSFGTDVTVDDDRGLLIISNSADNKLRVYDVKNTLNLEGNETQNNFYRINFVESKLSSANAPEAGEIVDALIANGYLTEFTSNGYEKLYWNENINEQEVLDFIRAHPQYSLITTDYYRGTLLRLVSQNYKLYHDVPQFLYEFGEKGSALGEFELPYGHDIGPDGILYVADSENSRIQKFELNEETGEFEAISQFGEKGRGEGQILNPMGISVDKKFNLVFVTDPINGKILVFSHFGEFITEFSGWNNQTAEKNFSVNSGIDTDNAGNFYVSNFAAIEKFTLVNSAPQISYSLNESSADLEIKIIDDWGLKKIRITGLEENIEYDLDYNLQETISFVLAPEFLEENNLTIVAVDSHNETKYFEITGQLTDSEYPQIFNMTPAGNSFGISQSFEISAQVTDNIGVENVKAEIYKENILTDSLNLSQHSDSKYSSSYSSDSAGNYLIKFIALDSSGNFNYSISEFTIVDSSPQENSNTGGSSGNSGSSSDGNSNLDNNQIIQLSSDYCLENWICSSWDKCENEKQTRQCSDSNSCGTFVSKPSEIQDCLVISRNEEKPQKKILLFQLILTSLVLLTAAIILLKRQSKNL